MSPESELAVVLWSIETEAGLGFEVAALAEGGHVVRVAVCGVAVLVVDRESVAGPGVMGMAARWVLASPAGGVFDCSCLDLRGL